MLGWILAFFMAALLATLLDVGGISTSTVGVGEVLVFALAVLGLAVIVAHFMRRR